MDTGITFDEVKGNQLVLECIAESDRTLEAQGYTDHGLRHVTVVADRARDIATKMGHAARIGELAAIASFCHDMGNFMGRTQHHYWGAHLFFSMFRERMSPDELTTVVQAIANHDKEEMKFTHPVAALLVLADKSDVHRSRVRRQPIAEIMQDIHDRVNYATTDSALTTDAEKKTVTLSLTIDTSYVPVMEYFEIFMERMTYCRKAATHLGYAFKLVINDFALL